MLQGFPACGDCPQRAQAASPGSKRPCSKRTGSKRPCSKHPCSKRKGSKRPGSKRNDNVHMQHAQWQSPESIFLALRICFALRSPDAYAPGGGGIMCMGE